MAHHCRHCQHLLRSGFARSPHARMKPLVERCASTLYACHECLSVFEFSRGSAWLLGRLSPLASSSVSSSQGATPAVRQ